MIDREDVETWFDVTGDPKIRIGITAHGGGTVGESYGQNGWDYIVTVDDETIIEGDDLRSGVPQTHKQMAQTLCGFLSAAGESLHYFGTDSEYADEYDVPTRQFLIDTKERFILFEMMDEDE